MDAAEIDRLTEVEDRHWWYAERRRLLRRRVARLRPGRALDVGAAGGGNTRVLRDLGWQALALEHSAPGAGTAAARGLPVLRGDATSLPLADRSLDLVTALDVLEHLTDDRAAVAELHRVLRPGGHLVVTVPVDPRLWSAHDEAVGHVRRYTVPGLRQLLQGAGFEITEVRSWMVVLRPLVALRRRRSTGSDLDDPPWWVNRVLGAAVSLDRLPGLGRLPGVSVLVCARRR
jgi:SAM-dependent methyltransferase